MLVEGVTLQDPLFPEFQNKAGHEHTMLRPLPQSVSSVRISLEN